MNCKMNKKGHFDFATLIIAVLGGAIAYLIAQTHLVKNLRKDKSNAKSEKTLRVRQ